MKFVLIALLCTGCGAALVKGETRSYSIKGFGVELQVERKLEALGMTEEDARNQAVVYTPADKPSEDPAGETRSSERPTQAP